MRGSLKLKWGVKILSLAAASLLVAACTDSYDEGSSSAQSGSNQASMSSGIGAGVGTQGVGSGELGVNVGDRVFFALDSSEINAESQDTLTRQAEWLKARPTLNISIEGHCDERGTREYNLALGERRASAVRNFLIAQGVDANRVTTISYGKERPAVPGHDESAWAQNRRGVTVVQ